MTILQYSLAKSLYDFWRPYGKVLSRPQSKNLFSAVKGMIQHKTVLLSAIGRGIQESILPKSYCEKVGFHLCGVKQLAGVQVLKARQADLQLLLMDHSDIQRPYAGKLEGVVRVRDGSTHNNAGQGYPLLSIIAKTKAGEYLPLVLQRYEEQNQTDLAVMQAIIAVLGIDHGGMWTLDRGFDDRKILDFLLDNEQDFLIRLDSNGGSRLVVLKREESEEEQITIQELVSGMTQEISYRRVYLPKRDEMLTVIVYRPTAKYPPLVLLTTKTPKNNGEALHLARLYLDRWKIEDYHRFIKTRFNLESIMLQLPAHVDGMLTLILIASAYVMKMEQCEEQRNTVINAYYQHWLYRNNVPSSWPAFSRFLEEYYPRWTLLFRTLYPPPLPHQLALLFT
jgi:hypothetical protein